MQESMIRHPSPLALAAWMTAVLITLVGCSSTRTSPSTGTASVASAEVDEANDPIEPVNRFIFDVNLKLDEYTLKPVAKGYRAAFPQPVRDSVHSFLDNLKSPIVFMNDVLQANVTGANATFGRFLINSTFGLGGLFDFAGSHGLPGHSADFGQTLGVWGVPEGPYLVLPIFGPSNPRDTTGLVADSLADPFSIVAGENGLTYLIFVRAGVSAIDSRSRTIELFDDLQRNSLDFYAAARSLYRQRRQAEFERRAAFEADEPSIAIAQAPLTEVSSLEPESKALDQ